MIIFLAGCRFSEERFNAVEAIVIDPDKVDQNLDLSIILGDSMEIIPLETTDSCLISDILRMEMTNTHIIISDRMTQKILLFDSLGNYVKTIGKCGAGPGEYARLGDFAVIGDSIKFLLGYYVDGNEFRYLLFNKETHENRVGKSCVIGNLGNLYVSDFRTTNNDELILVQPAGMLLSNWRSPVCKDFVAKKGIDELVAGIHEESNPVLFKYKIKK